GRRRARPRLAPAAYAGRESPCAGSNQLVRPARLNPALAADGLAHPAEGMEAEPRRPPEARRALRVHPLRLLLDCLPELLVEFGTLPRPGRAPTSAALHHGFARRGDRASARQSGRSVPALSLPHHHELRQSLPQASPSGE